MLNSSNPVFNMTLVIIIGGGLLLVILIALYMSRRSGGDLQYPTNRSASAGKGEEADEWRSIARNPLYTVQTGEEPGTRLVEQSAPAQRKGGSSEPVGSGAGSGGGEGGGGSSGGEGGSDASPA